ncbi:ABC transporter ATP-binding protein [Azospirillum halopraeferens]|uniref:ABC transporter ATP-binding protein n=1 Tax=Azospirillum halopraeferens TaxID=34010 RepID=UPI000426E1B1|nr:ABC transporter ATP-binding protein [Azospirillum halopraeferens]
MDTKPLVELDGVSKRYGAVAAVDGLDLTIDAGEFVAIMGPSGCGKTTTIKMLAGLETPSAGEIRLAGRRVNDLPVWERDTPLVWQSLALFPFLTVLENVEFGLRMRGVDRTGRRRRALSWLDRLGLAEFAGRNVADLSGGQRQRVALARSLVTEPPVLLLDEPLSALDAHLSVRMQAELKRLQREIGITFVYITHSHSEAFTMADRVVIMNKGRVEQIGAPKDIFLRPASRFVARFLGGNNLFAGRVARMERDGAVVTTADGSFRVARAAAAGVRVGDAVDLNVRSDRISLTQQTGWSGNEVHCRLVSEEFVGALVNLHLETAAGTEIVAQLQQRDLEMLDLSPGTGFVASWHPEDGHLIVPEAPQPLALAAE